MAKLIFAALWAGRTALGLCIAVIAAVLAYMGLSLVVSQLDAGSAGSPSMWAYGKLLPSIFLAFISAAMIKFRLHSIAIGGLLASTFVLVFGTPEVLPDVLLSISYKLKFLTTVLSAN